MSVPLSSAPPGTGPTSSQVTASVVKFRCLYTHDLRRKSKRWQDGYLRYHAFNKRIMVYDEQGNYIGDHHWRSGEEVQDGDELELDKGALIQVGERMGTTQQDLTNLFEKRKRGPGSPQANDHASQMSRNSTPVRASGSSQPFRSLNDLLGIKKTSTGHLVSPYEERHPPTPSNGPESSNRPSKRQKFASEKPVNKRQTRPQVVDLTESDKESSLHDVRAAAPSRQAPRAQPSRSSPPPNKPKVAHKMTQPATDSSSFTKPPLPSLSASAKRSSAPANSTARQEKPSVRPEPRERPVNILASLPPQALKRPSSEAPSKTLRMAPEKPRRKLMYSALLPGDTSQKSSPAPPKPEKRSQSTPSVDLSVRTNPDYSTTLLTSHRIQSEPIQEVDPSSTEFMPSNSTQFILEEMAHIPTRNLPAKRSLDAALRKSLSDPTALTARPALQTRPTLMRSGLSAVPESPPAFEEGPWTAEALDLFEFWPPGRPKPG